MVKVSDIKNDSKPSSFLKYLAGIVVIATLCAAVILKYPDILKYLDEISPKKYTVIKNYNQNGTDLVLYNIDPITSDLRGFKSLKLSIALELDNPNDIKIIKQLMPKIENIILTHTLELNANEIENIEGLYNLKEELLYRINLITFPVIVNDLNFRAIEISTSQLQG